MYNNLEASTTNSTIRTTDGLSVAQIWEYLCRRHGETPDYFADCETSEDDPSGADGIVITKNATSAGKGHRVNFRNTTGFYGEGKKGEALFTAVADFEKNRYSEYAAFVNVYRNATDDNEFTTEDNALRAEIERGAPQKLGAWLDRLKTETIDMRVRDTAHTSSLFTANSKGLNNLLSSDILDVNNIIMVSGQLSTMGGKPGRVGTIGKQNVKKWTFGPTTETLTTLQASSDYQTLLRASNTGIDYLLKGEIATLGSQIVRPYEVVNHDGDGPIGSARLPMGSLSVAIASGTAQLTILFGGALNATNDTTKLYCKHFLGYAYNWVSTGGGTFATGDETLASNPILGGTDFTGPKYVMIVNPSNAATDPNGVGYYEYYTNAISGVLWPVATGNNGNKIVCTRRLSKHASAIVAPGTLGAPTTTNTAVASFGTGCITSTAFTAGTSWTFTDVHPVGAMIYQCNQKGVPLAFTPVYGAGAILRPYGIHKMKRDMETEEGGFISRSYLRSYFGTQLRKDNLGRTPNVGVIAHAVKFPHHVLPTVTS